MGINATRRQFLAATSSGIALSISVLPHLNFGSNAHAADMAPPADWQAGPGKARFRIDGLRKVTGQKIYARDFRAWDMDGWPQEEDVVLVIRTPFANRELIGLDLDPLPDDLKPKRVVTGADLVRDKIAIAEVDFPAGNYLVEPGKVPNYLGQAVALLYYNDYHTMDRARRAIRSLHNKGIVAGPEEPNREDTFYEPETSVIHAVSRGRQIFSQVDGGPVRPQKLETDRDKEAMARVDYIRERLDNPTSVGWSVLRRVYTTQTVDPMFMEPESGLGWLDRDSGTLHMMIGTQSPSYDVNSAGEIFSDPDCPLGVKAVNLFAAYPGGGFGGRDTSTLCLFLALAAAYGDRPIRIAYDRFEQFQSGVKRHAAHIDLTLAVDDEGLLQAVRNHIYLNGGGRRNVSTYVAQVSALDGAGAYDIPLADIWSRARRTRAPIAGSMRGFGTVQSLFAMESMIDELAVENGLDPIDLRLRNVLAPDQEIVTGAPHAPPGLRDMCVHASQHSLWLERDQKKQAFANGDAAYGVGFALGMKNYGTGADAALDEVAIDADGTITVTTNVIDMGTGTATTLAISTAKFLGANATEVKTGMLAPFEALELEGSFELHPENPRWTPLVHESTKAASTSSKWVHGVHMACQVLLETGLLPAARDFWGATSAGVGIADVSWQDGALSASGLDPIPLATLAKHAHDNGHVVSAMIHAFYSGRWIEADYTVGDETFRWQIDALSILRGGQADRDLIDRQNPKLFTVESIWEGNGQNFGASACLAAVKVERKTGTVTLLDAVHYIGPGTVLQEDLMEGQLDGCFAMGVGQALLEYLPTYEEGAGNGRWNLNRYHVPLAGDVALHNVEKVILPPESDDAPARGIAEVAMVAVAPAIANAVTHATGVRFYDLPITADKVREAWRG